MDFNEVKNLENQFNYPLGAKMSPVDLRDYRLIFKAKAYKTYNEFPENYEIDLDYELLNQGQVNSCVAVTFVTLLNILSRKINSKYNYEYSIGAIYGNRLLTDHTGEGLVLREALDTVRKYGDCKREFFDYNKEVPEIIELFNSRKDDLLPLMERFRFKNYYSCPTEDEIKYAIMKYGCVVIGFQVWQNMYEITKTNPYLREPNPHIDPYYGGHCVLAVGWVKHNNQVYLKCANWWGKDWGDNGYFYMPLSMLDWQAKYNFPLAGLEAWAIDGMIINGTEMVPDGDETEEPTPDPKPEEPETPNPDEDTTPANKRIYRIRTSWEDVESQKGAYLNLDSAKAIADQYKDLGYKVYDWNGNLVYDPNEKEEDPEPVLPPNPDPEPEEPENPEPTPDPKPEDPDDEEDKPIIDIDVDNMDEEEAKSLLKKLIEMISNFFKSFLDLFRK